MYIFLNFLIPGIIIITCNLLLLLLTVSVEMYVIKTTYGGRVIRVQIRHMPRGHEKGFVIYVSWFKCISGFNLYYTSREGLAMLLLYYQLV